MLAGGLGMDAMSVCGAIGVRWHGPRQKLRLALHMGLFQFFMPLAGWLVGRQLAGVLSRAGGIIAGALVAAVGVKMLVEAARSKPGETAEKMEEAAEKEFTGHVAADPTRGWSLMALSLATSLDALVAGLSLGIRQESILLPSLVIGLAAAAMALAGVLAGQFVGKALGRPAEFIGALVLIALGILLMLS